MNISVTKGDIANGKRRSLTRCPIALATKRRAKTDVVTVDYESICVNGRHYHPIETFQSAFDEGGARAVKPSHFKLEAL